jgi:hypothetical protein
VWQEFLGGGKGSSLRDGSDASPMMSLSIGVSSFEMENSVPRPVTVRMKVLMMIQSGGHKGVVMGGNHGLRVTIGGIYYNPK